jgi:hypothetical protein
MGVVGSGGRVADRLESLESLYGGFTVNQTTVEVAPPVFERARDRSTAGLVDAIVRVWNDDGDVLHAAEGSNALPRRRGVSVGTLAESVRGAISTEFHVECTLDGVDRVTIAGVRNRGDREASPVYRLYALVDASYAAGDPRGGAWRPLDPHRPLRQPV